MNKVFTDVIHKVTGASGIKELEVIQSLWSGYGKIVRYKLYGSDRDTVVVKHVCLPDGGSHPRGWNTDLSHERKLRSYVVETEWYKTYNNTCPKGARVPECLALETHKDEVLMVLEDLDASGYPVRRNSVTWDDIEACLSWLAYFHAKFLHVSPKGLWEIGTYWHLDTRPDELEELKDKTLKTLAHTIDAVLNNSPFKTFVHGDAKLANFCFSATGNNVAAVDFQYVGGGCGMKDVAYFIGSCLYEEDCEKHEVRVLDYYFTELRKAVKELNVDVDMEALEENWRDLYHIAWTDFHRFLKGWSLGHWKINSYSERLVQQVLQRLGH
jgi:hypothetical protein